MFIDDLEQEYKEIGYQFYHAKQDANINTSPLSSIEETEKTKETESVSRSKRILLLTHQLSRTGAPLALFTMAMVLKKQFDVMVLTVEEGDLANDYLAAGIPVVNAGRYWERKIVFKSFAKKFDAVIANTVLHFPAVVLLNGLKLPVFWWIHEHENYFSYGRGEIPNPNNLKENIYVMVAGEYVRQVMLMEFAYDAPILHVGMQPLEGQGAAGVEQRCSIAGQSVAGTEPEHSIDAEKIIAEGQERPLHFLCVGTYSLEKGQDILVKAYKALPGEYKEKLSITFIGNEEQRDEEVYCMVWELEQGEPLVSCHPLMPRPEALAYYGKADGVICPSRREVLSMVVLENMMLEKCVLVSTATGNAAFIEDGVNGYVFEADNPLMLRDALVRMVDRREQLLTIGKQAVNVYQQYFSMEVFERNVKRMITGQLLDI